MKHILVTTANVEEALLNLAFNHAPVLFIIGVSLWLGWWASRKFQKVETRIDAVETNCMHKIELVEVRLNHVGIRLDRIEVRLDRIDVQLNELNLKLAALTTALLTTGKIPT